MRPFHGFTGIILLLAFLGLIALAGAEETTVTDYSDASSSNDDWGEYDDGSDSGISILESLFGEEFISNIIQFLIRLFLSLFSSTSSSY